VPASVAFATKPQLARRLIERVQQAGLPCAWVVADSVYGTESRLRTWLEARHQPYVLAVSAQYRIFDGRQIQWAADLVAALPARAWQKLSARAPAPKGNGSMNGPVIPSARWTQGASAGS
jgi:SRSO17 transposase